MKLDIKLDKNISENKIVIECNTLTQEIMDIQKIILDFISKDKKITFYKNNIEYYLNLSDILFFETDNGIITAHTIDDIFFVKQRLYELEKNLSSNFIRVSKSTIVNYYKIYSITKNITSSSLVEFKNTYKKTYVSRRYYNDLKNKLEQRRI